MAESYHINNLVFGRTDHTSKNLSAKVELNKPYKIIPDKYKLYVDHYMIPAALSLIVPTRILGEETACDVRWESGGQLQVMHNVVFVNENLMAIDLIADEQLYALWKDYSNQSNQ
jgi:hypothetical protein